ncbi:MAG: inositol monophosphatase family protein [Bacteroidota bacterium]
MNIDAILPQVIDAAQRAGEWALSERVKFTADMVEVKGKHNFVSYVDKHCEAMLVEALGKTLPEAGFIAEEGTGSSNAAGLNWIIDPLDGTTNYIHGLSPFAVSIALMDNDRVVLGVVYEASLKECFWATENGGAFLNGNPIKVTATQKVNDSLIATGFPYYDYSRISPFFQTMDYFMRNSHGLRRLGSAATDLVYVACGRFDAFYEYGLSPWDVAAGAFIVERAGGKVCDFRGGDNYIFGGEIVATNARIHEEFTGIIRNIMFS